MKYLVISLVLLVFLNPTLAVIWRTFTAPANWFRQTVVSQPFKMGAAVRGFLSHAKSADNVPGPTLKGLINDAIETSAADQLASGSILENIGNVMGPQIDYEKGKPTLNESGPKINLDDYLSRGQMFSPIPEIAAAKLEGFLKPVLDAASQHRDFDPEGESFETILIDRFSDLPDGEHVFDGNSIILNIKPRTGNSTQVKVAYVDLSELKPYLNNQLITVFTGLGNTSAILPFGFPNLDFLSEDSNADASPSTEIPSLSLTDYPDFDSVVPEPNVEQLVNELDNQPNVVVRSKEEQDETLSREPTKTGETFAEKLAAAANIVDVEAEPERMTIYSYQPDTVPDYVVNRFGRVSVPQARNDVTETAKPNVTSASLPGNTETNSDEPLVHKLQPVYKPTPSPSPVFRYDPLAPRPVYQAPNAEEIAKPTTTSTTEQPKVDGEEDMRMAIVNHVQGGVEGYLSHLKKNHDQNNCVSLMVCEIGAIPERYGEHGRQVVKFFRDRRFPEEDRVSNWYQTVMKLGDSVRTVPMCRSSFRHCLLNTQQLIELGRGLMFDIILNSD